MPGKRQAATLLFVLPLSLVAGCSSSGGRASLPEIARTDAAVVDGSSPSSTEADGAGKSGQILSGTLEPHRRSTLMARVPGPIVRVHVREGDFVHEGSPLITIDPEQYSFTLRQAEAGVAGAKVQLDAVKLEYDRHKALIADKAVPQSQFDMVEAKYKGAAVAVQAAEAALDMARKANRDTVIRAPYSGVIIRKHVSEGDSAAAMPPMPLITMEETRTLDLRVQVPASEMSNLKVGSPVTVHFPSGHPDLEAQVSRVVPTINPGTRTFSAIIEISDPKGTYRAGLFAEVRLGTRPAAEGGK